MDIRDPSSWIAMIWTMFSQLEMPAFTLVNAATAIAACAMIFGGVVPFIPQYRDIRRTENAEGFSTFVCLTLLIANTLRIMFWFGKHFELPLLLQSIIMNFTMLLMVHLCVSVKQKTEIIKSKSRKFSDFEIEHFWHWSDFGSYMQFYIAFTVLAGLFTFLFLNSQIYVEAIGFMAVFAEAMLGAPQFYRNFQNKSTQGMSKKMVGFWTMGDVFKTIYFIVRAAPAQFWLCGILQVSIDISILLQIFFYRNLGVLKAKLDHS